MNTFNLKSSPIIGLLVTLGSIVGMLPATPARADTVDLWGYCNEDNHLGYHDATFATRKPEADRICALISYRSSPEPQSDSMRCLNSELDKCANRLGQGGFEGPNDVPNGAWYYQPGASKDFPHIRCQCGCFTAETTILTDTGWTRIGELFAQAESNQTNRLNLSGPDTEGKPRYAEVKRGDFTKGPESKPILYLKTSSGKGIYLTDLHPVPVVRRGEIVMLQARDLVTGDIMQTTDGAEDEIVSIHAHTLGADNSVYNVNTKGTGGQDHIISANGLKVGDLGWQMQLSAESQRVDVLVSYTAK